MSEDTAISEFDKGLTFGERLGLIWHRGVGGAERYEKRLTRATALAEQGNEEQACPIYASIIRVLHVAPSLTERHRQVLGEAHVKFGDLLLAQDQQQEAVVHYKAAREQAPLPLPQLTCLAQWAIVHDPDSDTTWGLALDDLRGTRERKGNIDPGTGAYLKARCRVTETSTTDECARAIEACRAVIAAEERVEFAHFCLGLALVVLGQHEEALRALERSQALNPKRPDTPYFIAICRGLEQSKAGDVRGSIAAFDEATQLRPDAAEPAYRAGWARTLLCQELETTDPPGSETSIVQTAQQAVALLRSALGRTPCPLDCAAVLGRALRHAGDYVGAEQALRQSLETGTASALVCTELARTIMASGRSREAAEWLKQAHAADAESLETYVVAGELHLLRGKTELALKAYRKALQLGSSDLRALQGMGQVLFEEGDYERVVRHFGDLPSRSRTTALSLARAHLRLGDTGQAVAVLREQCQRGDAGWTQHYYLGCALAQDGQYSAAVQSFTDAIGIDAGPVQAYSQRGHAHYRSGDLEAARQDYAVAHQQAPTAGMTVSLVAAEAACGNLSQAIVLGDSALAALTEQGTEPEEVMPALQLLAAIREVAEGEDADAGAEPGADGDAESHYRRMLQLSPEDPYPVHRLGLIKCRASEWEEARTFLTRAVELGDTGEAVLFHLGYAAAAAGDHAAALAHFDELSQMHPDDERLALSRQRLRYLLGRQAAEQSEWGAAAEHWTGLLHARPEDDGLRVDVAEAWLRAALSGLERGLGHADMGAMLGRGLAVEPDHWGCRYLNALCQAAEGLTTEPTASFADLMDSAPSSEFSARARYHLAWTQALAADPAAAVGTLRTLLGNGSWPEVDLPVDFVYATACASAGEHEAALQTLQLRCDIGGPAPLTSGAAAVSAAPARALGMLEQAAAVQLPATCSEQVALLRTYCLLSLGNVDAVEVLLGAGHDNGNPAADYYAGLVKLVRGDADGAASLLGQAAALPAARDALAQVSKFLALTHAGKGDWSAAVECLQRALESCRNDPELREILQSLGSYSATVMLGAGHREDAAAVWEEAQQEAPGDIGVAHSLALLYYWTACHLEDTGRGEEAGPVWEGAIRNWVAVCQDGEFWSDWAATRLGGADNTAAASEELRTKLLEHLARVLMAYADAARDEGQIADLTRLDLLGCRLSAERRSAVALSQVTARLSEDGRLTTPPLICGSMMLDHLGQRGSAARALETARNALPDEQMTDDLHWALSSWVIPWSMVLEGRYAAALNTLMPALEEQPASRDGHDLTAMAFLEKGKALANTGDILHAIDAWLDGHGHVRQRQHIGQAILSEVEEAAVSEARWWSSKGPRATLLTRDIECLAVPKATKAALREAGLTTLRDMWDRGRAEVGGVRRVGKKGLAAIAAAMGELNLTFKPDDEQRRRLEGAIAILEAAIQIADTENVRSSLSGLLNRVGVMEANADRMESAKRLLERAIELDGMNAPARNNLAGIYRNEAIDLHNNSSDSEGAARLMRQAIGIDPTNVQLKKDLSVVLSNFGVKQCNAAYDRHCSQWREGVALLREALTLDPGNTHALQNLAEINELGGTDISAILQLMGR